MSRIDDWNYMNDPRNCERAADNLMWTYEEPYLDTDGTVKFEEKTIELPSRWEVCNLCDGEGRHVNPAIDAGGLSDDDRNDPEFMEDYMGGVYDIPCNCCGGKRVVKVLDRSRLEQENPKLLEAYDEWQEEEYYYRRMVAAELAMGA